MKKSTKLILLTVLVIFGSLIFYNFKLKEVYDSKSYKDRFAGMEFTPFSGVEQLNLTAEYNTKVQIEQGDKEGIWIAEQLKDQVKFAVQGKTLNLDLKGNKNWGRDRSIIMITKKITDIVVKHNLWKNGDGYFQGEVNVLKYKSAKLNLQLSGTLAVNLNDMEADTLNASVGETSRMVLASDTHVDIANFDLGVSGSVQLYGTRQIKTVNYTAESARVADGTKYQTTAKK